MAIFKRARVPEGVPTGGQFAVQRRGEQDRGTLSDSPPAPNAPAPAERIPLAGYIPSETAGALWDAAYGLRHSSVVSEATLSDLRARLPGTDDAEIEDALQRLADTDPGDAPGQRAILREIVSTDRARRGIPDADDPETIARDARGWHGLKYEAHRPIVDVAADVRADLKEAKATGYLPDDLVYAVRSEPGHQSEALSVTVQGLDDDQILTETRPWEVGYPSYTDEAVELTRRVRTVTAAYNYDHSEHSGDPADVGFHSRVILEDSRQRDLRLQMAARRREARAA